MKKMKQKIPKIIHYVWMGKNPIPPKLKKYMNTWKKLLPDFEIKEWNEENFDINSHPFVKDAYEHKQWAFVSDYVRFWAVYNYGGVYFDTDVAVIRRFDELLTYDAFTGFESKKMPFTAVFGAKKKHMLCKKVLDYYNKLKFDYIDMNNSVNTIHVSKILINDFKCIPNGKEQLLKGNILILPENILCSPGYHSKTVHIFTGSWGNVGIKSSWVGKIRDYFRCRAYNKTGCFIHYTIRKILFDPFRKYWLKIVYKKYNKQNEKFIQIRTDEMQNNNKNK